MNTVLHYTGSEWDGSGIHAVIRQLAQAPVARSILGVTKDYVAGPHQRLPIWRGPRIADEAVNLPNLWRAWVVAQRVRRWLRRGNQRIFHGHSRAGLLVGLWLHLFRESRVIVTVHCYGSQRWFYRLAKRCLGSRLVWLTPAMKCHYGYTDPSWDGCMPNGLAAALPATMHRGPTGGVLRLGGAGAMVRWKRWDLVLGALARLPAGCPVEFLHIGGPTDLPQSKDYEQELRALTVSLGLTERVRWLGWQSSSVELLKRVDAVVVPSDGEPFSMIALEALFAGVPVIATRGGGPEDFVLDGENGWLVPPGDAAALARCFERCLEPAAWQTLRPSPEHLQKFSLPLTLAAQWAEIYAAL